MTGGRMVHSGVRVSDRHRRPPREIGPESARGRGDLPPGQLRVAWTDESVAGGCIGMPPTTTMRAFGWRKVTAVPMAADALPSILSAPASGPGRTIYVVPGLPGRA